ncbi:hypothetical protein RB195_006171 [Necator americanus]|uniref:Regulator of microtubule dynamics protein 1 n=1 Tax=Necator americanus TaxID=51031 RepID=A0ABR1BRB7_NECAM
MSDVSNSFSAWETLPEDEPPLCIAVRRPVSPPRHYEAMAREKTSACDGCFILKDLPQVSCSSHPTCQRFYLNITYIMAAFNDTDELFGTDVIGEAYKKLKKRYEEGEKAPELLWRLARATLELADIESDKERKRYLILEATSCAVEAAIYDEKNINTLRWAAVATAYNSDYLFEMDKILELKKTIEYTTKGLRLNPDDYVLLFVRGRTIFQLCNLNSIERKKVESVFQLTGNEPPPSVDRARWYFLKSYEIEPKYLPNLHYLGLCLISQGNKEEARRILREAMDRRVEGANVTVQAECAELLKQC